MVAHRNHARHFAKRCTKPYQFNDERPLRKPRRILPRMRGARPRGRVMKRGRTVVTVPISAIKVLNSRERNQGRFRELVQSVATLGLKRPITVCKREGPAAYDLVCGERRLDAFIALGQTDIPALLVDAAADDCI